MINQKKLNLLKTTNFKTIYVDNVFLNIVSAALWDHFDRHKSDNNN